MKTKLFLTGLALAALVTVASAQTTANNAKNGRGTRTSFVDNNKNGVCDNYENRSGGRQGNAYCKGKGRQNGRGNGKGLGKGNGRGNGTGNGQRQFVDANKNGICDNRE
jgi:hypothetical protein